MILSPFFIFAPCLIYKINYNYEKYYRYNMKAEEFKNNAKSISSMINERTIARKNAWENVNNEQIEK